MLNKLEKSIAQSGRQSLGILDQSIVLEDIDDSNLIDFESILPPIKEEDISNLDMQQSLNRLFKFIEIESNISLDKLDGLYQNLKTRINKL